MVTKWDHTPWYLRIFGYPAFRRPLINGAWEYYDEAKHGRGIWVR
jgi:hypothetical protein